VRNSVLSSIKVRILAASILPAIFACLALTLYYLNKRAEESRTFLETRGEQLSKDIAAISEFALISGSAEYLDDAISKLVQEPEIYSIKILDKSGNTFLFRQSDSYGSAEPSNLMHFKNPAYRLIKDINTFDLTNDINLDMHENQNDSDSDYQLIGYVEVEISPHVLQTKQIEILYSGIILAIIVLLISTFIGLLYSHSLLNPIKLIVSSVRKIRDGGYESRINIKRKDELGKLADDIDKLAAQLQTSKEEIGRKMVELTEARENADRANATKSMFLARVTHELRDPLTSVVGNLEILLNTQTSQYQERAIRLAEKNAEFLLRQIDDILEFSLLEAGQYHIDYQYFKIAEVVEVVQNIIKPKADSKQLSFSIDLQADRELADCRIESDPVRIQQILINLIGNAIKFTHQGSVYTSISLKRASSAENKVRIAIEVADTGIGIAKEHMGRIFQMFEQVQSPVSRDHRGVGLGLSITKCIVEAMGGEIIVESEPLKGSKFIVNLETKYSFGAFEEGISVVDKYDETSKTEKILLVEDNPDNQRVISTLLHNIGIYVDIANNGIEGLQKFKAGRYDIVFIDCFMPHMDGFEFTRLVREHESRSGSKSKTMLIGLTAGAHRQNIEKCYATGMDDVITKPFYRIDIYKRVLGLKKAQSLLKKMADISND
jgi:two-component system, sensor histidine kinase